LHSLPKPIGGQKFGQLAEIENARRRRIGGEAVDFLAVSLERDHLGKAQRGSGVAGEQRHVALEELR
jgi:hypothetical protein